MDPRRLLTFRTVARAGSLSAGARELGWSQPAVSQQLAQLEREAGTALLLRGPRGVKLTEAGTALLAQADAIDSHLRAASSELAEFTQATRGRVRLAAFPSGLAALVPPALADLAATRPGIEVLLSEAEPPEAIGALRDGEADLALTFRYDRQPAPEGLVSRELGREPVHLVLPRDDAGVGSLVQLRERVWVAGCERCRAHLLEVCQGEGFVPQIRHTTDDYVVVQALVAQGLAVAVLPESSMTAFQNPGVVSQQLPELGSRTIELSWRPGVERVPAVAALIASLVRSQQVSPSSSARRSPRG